MPTDGAPAARVAAGLREIAELLALEAGNQFRVRAYARAAGVIAGLPELDALVRQGQLTRLPGIGNALASVITELQRTGESTLLAALRARYPRGTAELAQVLSLPRVRLVHAELGVTTLAELRAACVDGRVRTLPGFGEKSERRLLLRIDALPARRQDVLLPEALRQATALREHLAGHPAAAAVEIAGGLRRRIETIDRLELVVAADDADAVVDHARRASALAGVANETPTEFAVRQPGALPAHVRVVAPREFGSGLVLATGSAAHVARLGELAACQGLAFDAHGLRERGRTLDTWNEEELYARLDLAFVPAELREDAGDVDDIARAGRAPELVDVADVRGAVHCHTTWSDGKHTVEEMARAAEARGFDYLTITDHSTSASYAGGLDADRLRRQADEIARVRESVAIRILHGTECDILEDGALDFPDVVLARLDVVIASVHRRHQLDRAETTRRVVRALRHPLFKIWGHALGRYVLSRPPFECDMDAVLDAVADSRAAIEINGDPNRLDLAPPWIRLARRRNIRFVVSSDAHSTSGLDNVRWGVDMARRGGLGRDDVLNTRDADAFASAVKP